MAQLGGGRRRPIAMAAESANARYVDRRCARATRVLTGAGFTSLGTLRSGDRRGRFLDLGRWSASGEGRGEGGRAGFPLCHLGSADRHNPLRRASHRVRGPAQPALQSVSLVPIGHRFGWNSVGGGRGTCRGRFGLCHRGSADLRRRISRRICRRTEGWRRTTEGVAADWRGPGRIAGRGAVGRGPIGLGLTVPAGSGRGGVFLSGAGAARVVGARRRSRSCF